MLAWRRYIFGGDGWGAVAEGISGVGDDAGEPVVIGPGEPGHFAGIDLPSIVGTDQAMEDDAEGDFLVAHETLRTLERRGERDALGGTGVLRTFAVGAVTGDAGLEVVFAAFE